MENNFIFIKKKDPNDLKYVQLSDEQKSEIEKLILEKTRLSEISKKLSIKRWVIVHHYRYLLKTFGDMYKLPANETIYGKFMSGGVDSILDTKFGQSLKKLESFNIPYKVFIKNFTNRVNNKDLTVEVACSKCGKIIHRSYAGLIRSVNASSFSIGELYCKPCYNRHLNDPIVTKNKDVKVFVGVHVNKTKYKDSDFMLDDNGQKIYCANSVLKIDGESKSLKLFSYKKYGKNCILFAALFRECFIVLNNLPNIRNFSDIELLELLKKYGINDEYLEIKNKIDINFEHLFVDETNA